MIKHIKVTNFRSLRNFELDLGKNNVIVGPNNSGKSNLIDFFRFLRDLIVPSPQNTYGLYSGLTSRGGFNQIAWRGGDLSEITIQLDGVVPRHQNDDLSWRYTLEILGNFQWNSATIKSENLLITSKD
jgi:predicted ATPase